MQIHSPASSSQFLQNLINAIADPLLVKDRQHRWVLFNDAFCKFVERQPEELLHRTDADFLPAEQVEVFWQKDEQVFVTGITTETEELFQDTAGHTYEISVKKSLLQAESGELFLVCITRDVRHYKQIERESQQRLQLVMDNIPQLIFWKDRDSVYQGCNQNGARVVGVDSPDAIVGWTDYDMPWTTEQADWYRECDQRVMATGIADLHIIEPQRQANNKQAWLDTNKIPLRDEQGNAIGILVTIEDITDRKAAEEALIASEARFRSIVENANDTIVMLTPQGEMSYTSPRWLEMFGYTPQEALYQNFEQFIHPDDLPFCLGIFSRVATGAADAITLEYRAIHRDGSCRWHTTNLSSIKDAVGQVQHCIAIVRDVTDRRQAEDALQRKEQFLRSIYHGVEHPIFVVDVLGDRFCYVDWNRAAEKASGIAAEQIIGKTPEQVYGAGVGQIGQQRLIDCFKTGQPFTYEEWQMQDGEMTWWQTTLNPLRNEQDKIYQIVGTTFNVTERKLAEAQLQQQANDLQLAMQELQQTQMQMIQSEKMSSLGQLVAGVAHEINNPVNFISGNLSHANGYTQDLLELVQLYATHYPEPAAEIAAAIESIELDFLVEDLPKLLSSMWIGAERIQTIVASLRSFSRMDEAEMKAISVHEGIDSTLMILQSRLKAKGSQPQIQVIKQYGELPLVECYAGQLNQVFMNILTNAIDALEEQAEQDAQFSPQITIRTEQQVDQICVQIADNGAGMSEAVRQRLFDPFFTTKPVGKGTGMGLSISYQIITKKHGGSLCCASAPGQGTLFSVIVPILQAACLS